MITPWQIPVVCKRWLMIGAFLVLPNQVAAAEQTPTTVTVHVASGRSFTGEVHPRTDGSSLWLRWAHGSVTVLRPIEWDRVLNVEMSGQTLSPDELRHAVAGPATTPQAPAAVESPPRNVIRLGSHRPRAAGSTTASGASAGSPPSPAWGAATGGATAAARARVCSLAIDAWPANWDADVEVDGLMIEVQPRARDGSVAPVDGLLEVDLMGWRGEPASLAQPLERMGRWSQPIRPDDFGPYGAQYALPFQSVHPEFDLRWAPHGAVHARLSVPGQGTFETTEGTVRIRPYSLVRDQIQQTTGARFFWPERTGGPSGYSTPR